MGRSTEPSNKELKLTKPGAIGALVIEDPDHSETEDRFILLGLSAALRVLFVCHCVRKSGSLIRIISARRANQSEAKQYTERLRR